MTFELLHPTNPNFCRIEFLFYDLKWFQISMIEKSFSSELGIVESTWAFERLVRRSSERRTVEKEPNFAGRREISQLRVSPQQRSSWSRVWLVRASDPLLSPRWSRILPEFGRVSTHWHSVGQTIWRNFENHCITHFRRVTRRAFSKSPEPRVQFSK